MTTARRRPAGAVCSPPRARARLRAATAAHANIVTVPVTGTRTIGAEGCPPIRARFAAHTFARTASDYGMSTPITGPDDEHQPWRTHHTH
jgi:hypothetical protein